MARSASYSYFWLKMRWDTPLAIIASFSSTFRSVPIFRPLRVMGGGRSFEFRRVDGEDREVDGALSWAW